MSNKYEAAFLEPHFTTLVAERFAIRTGVPAYMLEGVEVAAMHDMLADNLAIRLAKDVYGEKLRPEEAKTEVSVPATWWQHYRFEHRSAWWLRWHVKRWPVRLSRIEMTATWDNYVMYPWAQLRSPVPEHLGDPVRQTRLPAIRVEQPVDYAALLRRGSTDE